MQKNHLIFIFKSEAMISQKTSAYSCQTDRRLNQRKKKIYKPNCDSDSLIKPLVSAGVIDEDYRGNVGVVIFNHSDIEFPIKKGDRIAQLICEKIYYPVLQEVTNLSETDRGEGGFGSTGTK